MNKPNFKPGTLWTGDNLPIMRGMNSACIDLVYLDPPFNSKTNYSAPIGSKAAGAAFKDTWALSDLDSAWLGEIAEMNPALHAMVRAAGLAHGPGMQSYLTMMGVRLLEIQRILKPTGSVWLHCDSTASHPLKMLMDIVFGRENFLNEVIWKRHTGHAISKKSFDSVSDILLFYSQDPGQNTFNPPHPPIDPGYLKSSYRHWDADSGLRYRVLPLEQTANKSSAGESRNIGGRVMVSEIGWRWSQKTFDARLKKDPNLIHWSANGRPGYKLYYDPSTHEGTRVGDVWTDIPFIGEKSKERTGYPTQKPLALLKRIIGASSDPGDLVMDPFCGCATTLVAARNSDREWGGH